MLALERPYRSVQGKCWLQKDHFGQFSAYVGFRNTILVSLGKMLALEGPYWSVQGICWLQKDHNGQFRVYVGFRNTILVSLGQMLALETPFWSVQGRCWLQKDHIGQFREDVGFSNTISVSLGQMLFQGILHVAVSETTPLNVGVSKKTKVSAPCQLTCHTVSDITALILHIIVKYASLFKYKTYTLLHSRHKTYIHIHQVTEHGQCTLYIILR